MAFNLKIKHFTSNMMKNEIIEAFITTKLFYPRQKD